MVCVLLPHSATVAPWCATVPPDLLPCSVVWVWVCVGGCVRVCVHARAHACAFVDGGTCDSLILRGPAAPLWAALRFCRVPVAAAPPRQHCDSIALLVRMFARAFTCSPTATRPTAVACGAWCQGVVFYRCGATRTLDCMIGVLRRSSTAIAAVLWRCVVRAGAACGACVVCRALRSACGCVALGNKCARTRGGGVAPVALPCNVCLVSKHTMLGVGGACWMRVWVVWSAQSTPRVRACGLGTGAAINKARTEARGDSRWCAMTTSTCGVAWRGVACAQSRARCGSSARHWRV
jgi:hypothetical protein